MMSGEATALVATLRAAWPAAQWTEKSTELYVMNFMSLDLAIAKRATARAVRTRTFMPSIAEFLEVYRAAREDAAVEQARLALPERAGPPSAEDRALAVKRVREFIEALRAKIAAKPDPLAPVVQIAPPERTKGHGGWCTCERCLPEESVGE